MKKLTGKIFDENRNLINRDQEELLGKTNLACWIHGRGFIIQSGPLAETILFTDLGTIIRTNQRIICMREVIIEDEKIYYIEIPVNEIIQCKKGFFGVDLSCIDTNAKKYHVQFSPRKKAVEFFNDIL